MNERSLDTVAGPPRSLRSPGGNAHSSGARWLERALERAMQYCFERQEARGAWQIEPDPRMFDTGVVALALSRSPGEEARAAVARARRWLEGASPQDHNPLARLIDEAPRQLLGGAAGPLDLSLPSLYSDSNRRRALLLYTLALYAGVEVRSPHRPADVLEQVRRFYQKSGSILMKRWGKVDLIATCALLEALDGSRAAAEEACRSLMRMQSAEGDFCRNPLTTAIAFLALTICAPESPAWQRCRAHLLQAQQPDGTWRFTTSDSWDTSLILRGYGEQPAFAASATRGVDFLVGAQNADGGWGYRIDVESDNDTTSSVLLALRGHEGEAVHRAVQRGLAYLLEVQRPDGLWNTWQSSEDQPTEDCVAHVAAAIAAFRGYYTPSIGRAQRWLAGQYERNGRWNAGWYRNLAYSTLEARAALHASHPLGYRAVRSLRALQNPDGGFPPELGDESTASATGLAVAALAESYDVETPFLRRALDYLLDTQQPTGTWQGHPEMFGPRPLRYHLQTNTHAFVGMGLSAAWRRLAVSRSAG